MAKEDNLPGDASTGRENILPTRGVRRRLRPAWLLLGLAGVALGYGAVWSATPCCGGTPVLPPPNSISGLLLALAGIWVILSVFGVIGLLPTEASGAKVKWAAGVAVAAWVLPFLYLLSTVAGPRSGAPNPLGGIEIVFLVAIVPAATLSAFALWFLFFLGDLIRHRLRPRSRIG